MGALQAAMMLGAVWWAWIDTSWITNWLTLSAPVRVMLFVLMGLGLVMSISLPEAFGEKGLVFAVAFVATCRSAAAVHPVGGARRRC
jgi:low temperature requirement protein LtrA